ncbi:MAG TPA: DoxX family protein [Ilumatobacter sp.]
MTDQQAIDVALLVLRCAVGGVMLAHGVNHIVGGGRIPGVTRWFASLGMRQPALQAWMASLTEVAAGAALIVGGLTPFGGAGVVGTMTVAWIINHRTNGFFIFRPGEGWEYVMTLVSCGVALGAVGPGRWSLDHALGIDDDLVGVTGLLLAAGAGGVGALVVLVAFWRPPR